LHPFSDGDVVQCERPLKKSADLRFESLSKFVCTEAVNIVPRKAHNWRQTSALFANFSPRFFLTFAWGAKAERAFRQDRPSRFFAATSSFIWAISV
jgi:hypothetical protein